MMKVFGRTRVIPSTGAVYRNEDITFKRLHPMNNPKFSADFKSKCALGYRMETKFKTSTTKSTKCNSIWVTIGPPHPLHVFHKRRLLNGE
jgi:hypothetical protein